MAQLLLISDKSLAADGRQTGDIVGVFEDSHVFSGHEHRVFGIVKRLETVAEINAIRYPETDVTADGMLTWKDMAGIERRLVTKPPFEGNYKDGFISETYSRAPENMTAIAIEPIERER